MRRTPLRLARSARYSQLIGAPASTSSASYQWLGTASAVAAALMSTRSSGATTRAQLAPTGS